MLLELLKNPVLISVALMLILSALRLNVVFSLVISATAGGFIALDDTIHMVKVHPFSYAMLGAFSIAISRSGITELLAKMLFKQLNKEATPKNILFFKYKHRTVCKRIFFYPAAIIQYNSVIRSITVNSLS